MRNRFWTAAGAIIGAVSALYWYSHRVERVRVSLEHFTYCIDAPGIPAAGLTILHLSDFHFRANDPVQEARLARLNSLLANESYDILAFTGDLIHNRAGMLRALTFLGDLRPALGGFCVPGNRDYWESSFRALLGTEEECAGLSMVERAQLAGTKTRRMLRAFAGNKHGVLRMASNDAGGVLAALASLGIQPLLNTSFHVTGRGLDLWVAGVDDMTNGKPDLGAALQNVPDGPPLVLLAHNPDIWLDERARGAHLILSGHTHGGQLRLPVVGAWYRQGVHLSAKKAAGWFVDGGSAMYVTRGLGESFPFRFGAPPQAALIRLARSESEGQV